ncbi:long-chain-fatty-acid--CoA ligase [Lysinibacillus alkalisoli]|uniref:Long-chain-fatty-acid--CoA ligase n=1 Tax=Lysinibacillus alkalisoli TaxID=1911548 RepID=A0A917LIE5_9BACI|nr:AMP-binding protein [Lysinibacillus alkalisoli]GGG28127.1 long-chain-fatty-acid--CoA ligase [Lysinibacillus alkalisoli]
MEDKLWFANYPQEIPTSLTYEKVPVQHFLTRAFEETPDKIAIHFLGRELTYRELYESSLKFGNYLLTLGIEKGDRIAIMLPNSPQGVIAYYGAMYAGAVVVQTNPLYTERELEYQLIDSGAKVIVALDILYPRVMKVMKQTALTDVIITAVKDYLPFPKNVVYPFIQKKDVGFTVHVKHSGANHLFMDIMKSSVAAPIQMAFDYDKDLALLQYTGGTTGYPKGVMLTHKNLTANVMMCDAWLYKCKHGEESIIGVLPFFHVYGMTTVMLLSVLTKNKMILLPKFDALTTLKTIHKLKPTLFPGAPTLYIGLLNHPDLHKYDLTSIKACISGSAPLPVEVQERFEEATKGKLVEGYGLTETSPVTHANLIWGQRVRSSIGIPWPDTDAKIVRIGDHVDMAFGEVGELVIKGPQVMTGYWERPEETQATFTEDGWLLTGDLGYMDENGYFYVVDRKKDMIIAGGFNIYPREVEEVLYEHEAIQECVVIGVPDAYRGETVKAFIVLKEGKQVTSEELNTYCRKNLAAYKVPRQYEFRKDLPKTTVGKILRRTLIDEEKAKLSSVEA